MSEDKLLKLRKIVHTLKYLAEYQISGSPEVQDTRHEAIRRQVAELTDLLREVKNE